MATLNGGAGMELIWRLVWSRLQGLWCMIVIWLADCVLRDKSKRLWCLYQGYIVI